MPPESPSLPLLSGQPSPMLGIGDDSEFQLLLDIMAVSGAAMGTQTDGTTLPASASLKSPFEAASDGFDPFDYMQLHCGAPLPHPVQAPPTVGECGDQTPLRVEAMSGPLSSLLRPVTPQRSGSLGGRQRLVRRLSRTGSSSQGSAGDTPGDASSLQAAHAEHAAEPCRVAVRAGKKARSQRRAAALADGISGGMSAGAEPSLKRRLQNREAQQRRRQRLKARQYYNTPQQQLRPRICRLVIAD